MLESAIVITRNLATNASGLVHLDQRALGIGIDSQLAVSADNLSHIVLASSHHARRVEVSHLAAPELDNADTVIHILVLSELGLNSADTHRHNALDDGVLAEVPQSKIDVVDVAIDEDTTTELSVGNEETGGVELVASLGAEDGGTTNSAVIHALESVTVRGVEAAREAAHHLKVWLLGSSINNGL